jgi:hypothetical protein
VCWWSRKQTSPRETCAAALGALAIFHSLPALQRRQNCTPRRREPKQGRRCCIPSQHRRAAMTPPRPANRKRAVLPPRVAAAACRCALGLRPLGVGARAAITTGGTRSEMWRVALVRRSLAAMTTSHVTKCVAILRADGSRAFYLCI